MFIDTSGLVCVHHAAEAFHKVAQELYDSAHNRLTHSYVLAEYLALVQARRFPRSTAIRFLFDMLDSNEIEVFWVG